MFKKISLKLVGMLEIGSYMSDFDNLVQMVDFIAPIFHYLWIPRV